MRRLTSLALLLVAIGGFAVVGEAADFRLPVRASHAGGADSISIDMDPNGIPANGATSAGSVEFCTRINENGVLDADEDAVDSLMIDAVTGPSGIPASITAARRLHLLSVVVQIPSPGLTSMASVPESTVKAPPATPRCVNKTR